MTEPGGYPDPDEGTARHRADYEPAVPDLPQMQQSGRPPWRRPLAIGSAVVILIAVGVGLGVGLSSSGSSAAAGHRPTINSVQLDSVYLDSLHADFAGVTDAQLLTLGHDFCKDFDNGTAWVTEIETAIRAGFTAYQAGELVGSAIATYCPKYESMVPRANGQ